jgi:SmpA/OmlA family protein
MARLLLQSFLVALSCALIAGLGAPPAHADDAARINFLESEIQRLRNQIDEQNRRIERLEAALAQHGAGAPGRPVDRRAETATGAAKATGPQPWHALENWDRVTKGMTQEEVTKVLGEPTAVQSVDNYKTLFYSGIARDGRTLNGLVNLRDERVVAVKKPT